jgi:hypothetical protein
MNSTLKTAAMRCRFAPNVFSTTTSRILRNRVLAMLDVRITAPGENRTGRQEAHHQGDLLHHALYRHDYVRDAGSASEFVRDFTTTYPSSVLSRANTIAMLLLRLTVNEIVFIREGRILHAALLSENLVDAKLRGLCLYK